MTLMIAIAGCSGSAPRTETADAGPEPLPDGGSDGPPIAAFDCSAIQGPLSTNRFYENNPTYTDPVDDSASWTLSTPEAQNLDSARLEQASTTLANRPFTWSLLVIRHDALVFERYYHGSAKNQSNNVHSASKSIWGAAIGIAINQGLIPSVDATIASILPASYVSVMSTQTRTVKVHDLIKMTSGIEWSEDTTENEIQRTPDWITAILELPNAETPGSTFNYSTGDAHLSSGVLTSAVHSTACEFIHKHLLVPLGVVAEHWGRDPQGYFSGGYNLYLTPRELAKLGLLYLHGWELARNADRPGRVGGGVDDRPGRRGRAVQLRLRLLAARHRRPPRRDGVGLRRSDDLHHQGSGPGRRDDDQHPRLQSGRVRWHGDHREQRDPCGPVTGDRRHGVWNSVRTSVGFSARL